MEEIWEDDLFLEALDWWEEGKSYGTIRTKLAEKGLQKERIDYFIRMIDEYAMDAAYVKQARQKHKLYTLVGIIIMVVGLILSWYAEVNSIFAYVTYGLILAGGATSWLNYKSYKSLDPDIRERQMHFQGMKKPKT